MSAFFVQKTSEEHLASLKSPSRQNPQIQETNFGNSVSCNGYAENGFNQMSQRLHHFIREHIIRGTWQKKELRYCLTVGRLPILTSVRRSY